MEACGYIVSIICSHPVAPSIYVLTLRCPVYMHCSILMIKFMHYYKLLHINKMVSMFS